ncbi:MAG: hypothetical protein QM484_08330 [Woeseiaceae bacterium]
MIKPPEIIHGDKSLRLTFYIMISSYLLFVIAIEPAIDLILLLLFETKNPEQIILLNKAKEGLSALVYSVAALIPAMSASWYGYRIVASSKLPPLLLSAKAQFPFTVVVIRGKRAKMFGVLLIIVSLVLVFQVLLHLIKVIIL